MAQENAFMHSFLKHFPGIMEAQEWIKKGGYQLGSLDLTKEIVIDSVPDIQIGSFSTIYYGTWRGLPVVAKVLKNSKGDLKTARRRARRELLCWLGLDHSNIVPLYGFAQGGIYGSIGALISPRCDYDMDSFLNKHGLYLPHNVRVSLLKQVAEGLAYLHSQSVVHGDLKPANILIVIVDKWIPNLQARLCDFGLATFQTDNGHSGFTSDPHTGTTRYLAPELLKKAARPTKRSDIYALGCVGLKIIFLQHPYENRPNSIDGLLYADITTGVPPARPPVFMSPSSSSLWDIIQKCWKQNPFHRPSASGIARLIEHAIDEGDSWWNPEETARPYGGQMGTLALLPSPAPSATIGSSQSPAEILMFTSSPSDPMLVDGP